jgi:hypothetical protein
MCLLSLKICAQTEQNIGKTIDSSKTIINQVSDEELKHFTFLDIPINGSIKQFVKELKKQKFVLEEITDVDAVLNGRFSGDKVQLLVQGEKETVLSVSVIFPLRNSWTETKETYNYIKTILVKNYGEPKIITEIFEKPFVDGLGNEKEALKEGKCIFENHFTTEKGEGMLGLKIHTDMSIILEYVDTANYLKLSEEAKKKF